MDEWGSGSVEPCRETAVASSSTAVKVTAARDPHLGKSPGEWSAGETLLMLEDACKNERKHSKYLLEMTRVLAMLSQSLCTQCCKAVGVLIDNGVTFVHSLSIFRGNGLGVMIFFYTLST